MAAPATVSTGTTVSATVGLTTGCAADPFALSTGVETPSIVRVGSAAGTGAGLGAGALPRIGATAATPAGAGTFTSAGTLAIAGRGLGTPPATSIVWSFVSGPSCPPMPEMSTG